MTRTFTIEKGTETYGGTDTGSDGGKERNAGAVKIFLNASSKQDDVSKELRAFLDYVAGVESEDGFVQRVAEAVREAKKNREWRHEYMTLLMRDQENI